ncbi:MAG: transporter, MMPL family [uncultured Solirubrobacteraceae bacterium]|uniref:Transporter, MMPL family n=1 Tax=uncultured Solirubrobacteraceae bacterium TaxID=1162706 RepID=A0A6J4T9Z3_9ACTN|nr:MAG: transporter, MMPL family [uncultured Solirubrobacteraceae bacterium]
MSSLFTLSGLPRVKWFVALVWLAAVGASFAFSLPARFADAEQNESSSFLPGDAESTRALEKTQTLTRGELAPMVVVYRRAGGLTSADRRVIAADREAFNALREEKLRDSDPRTAAAFRQTTELGPAQPSRDGTAAIAIANIAGDGESETIIEPVEAARELISDPGGGLEAKVTGGAGFAADAIKVFETIDGTLVGAAFLLVLVLLVLIYRSPIFFLIPLFAVGMAEIATRALGYGVTELGVTVNGQSSSILSVLVLGAGTDYALLLVARYREELRRHEDKHEAMALALRTAGPAIFASGLTVIAALLCLTLAEVNGTSGLGPIGALGIAVAMLAMLTLLPALLTIFGRRAFWPFIPRVGGEGADETHGIWRRVGERVAVSPRRVWMGTAVLLAVFALGTLNFDDGLTQGNSFRGEVESVQGQELLAQSFPAGANAPTEVFVPDARRAPAVAAAVREAPGVEDVAPVAQGPTGVLLNATLETPPFATESFDLIAGIREAAQSAGGPQTLVGGATAVESDLREATDRDTRLIIPLAIVVVFLILVVLLRALVAPLILIATVILSFAAALGVGALVFDVIFGFPGSDPSLPLFAFVFLVALGIDYNIFLMARVREETQRHGTRQGMIRGLAVTGGVITSAGIVLAGTFSVLAVLPLVFLTQLGFVIAFGVLLDTFVVRSILVPALVLDAGPRIWWPSNLDRTDRPPEAGFEPRPAPAPSVP